jgi:hypothetical protein
MGDGSFNIRWGFEHFVLLAILVLIGWLAYRGTFDFIITVRRGKVTFRGRFLELAKGETVRFLRDDIAPRGTVRILGRRTSRGVLRLRFWGPLDAGQRQRVRNFLSVALRG